MEATRADHRCFTALVHVHAAWSQKLLSTPATRVSLVNTACGSWTSLDASQVLATCSHSSVVICVQIFDQMASSARGWVELNSGFCSPTLLSSVAGSAMVEIATAAELRY